jgi:5-methyltetrahydrofolate--homocysteine methyltransferase
LGHVTFEVLREGYRRNAEGLVAGGVDGLIVETSQDLLQVKAAVLGAREAIAAAGRDVVLVVQVTIETNGAMLLGSEIGAALAVIEPLGVDVIGLNCATGPAEMSEHLRYLARHCKVGLSCMPNAGLPELTSDGARYPLGPSELAAAQVGFVERFGVGLVGGCCGTTPEHIAAVAEAVAGRPVVQRQADTVTGAASLYAHVPFSQDASYLAIGERTNANGSRVFREAMLAGRWDECVEIARSQVREGAHLLDVCVDYVGRDGVADMRELAFRLATASTLPLVLDSTEPAVLEAGLRVLGGRAVINSVNFEDGDGPDSRFTKIMGLVREHGAAVVALTIDEEGQARDADWKVRVADRLVGQLTGDWGMEVGDILIDCLTFPIATGQEETRRDAYLPKKFFRKCPNTVPAAFPRQACACSSWLCRRNRSGSGWRDKRERLAESTCRGAGSHERTQDMCRCC